MINYLNYVKIEALHKRMGTPREKIESEWSNTKKKLNANFRSREISRKQTQSRKEAEARASSLDLKNFLNTYENNDNSDESESDSQTFSGLKSRQNTTDKLVYDESESDEDNGEQYA